MRVRYEDRVTLSLFQRRMRLICSSACVRRPDPHGPRAYVSLALLVSRIQNHPHLMNFHLGPLLLFGSDQPLVCSHRPTLCRSLCQRQTHPLDVYLEPKFLLVVQYCIISHFMRSLSVQVLNLSSENPSPTARITTNSTAPRSTNRMSFGSVFAPSTDPFSLISLNGVKVCPNYPARAAILRGDLPANPVPLDFPDSGRDS